MDFVWVRDFVQVRPHSTESAQVRKDPQYRDFLQVRTGKLEWADHQQYRDFVQIRTSNTVQSVQVRERGASLFYPPALSHEKVLIFIVSLLETAQKKLLWYCWWYCLHADFFFFFTHRNLLCLTIIGCWLLDSKPDGWTRLFNICLS